MTARLTCIGIAAAATLVAVPLATAQALSSPGWASSAHTANLSHRPHLLTKWHGHTHHPRTTPAPTTPATSSAPPSTTAVPTTTVLPSTSVPPSSTVPPSTTAVPSTTSPPPSTTAPSTTATSTSPKPVGVPGTWTLAFDDEFNGTALDRSKWSPHWFIEGGNQNNVNTYASNVAVGGGQLSLTLASSNSGASVSTNPHGGATTGYELGYGYTEARIYFPGNGTQIYNWPAWWTDGQSWPSNGENDIAEGLGTMTVNYHSSSGSHNQGTVPGVWSNAFHTYGLYRQPGKCAVYFDGVLVKSYSTDDAGAPEYLILNVGAHSSGNVYGSSGAVKVDYVRAWK
jgi:hypothetical protein